MYTQLTPVNAKSIDYTALFPNRKNPEFNSAIIIFRDEFNDIYLAFIEKVNSKIEMSLIEEELTNWFRIAPLKRKMEFTFMVEPTDDKVLFKIIALSDPKEMTLSEIEKVLGYRVKIKE